MIITAHKTRAAFDRYHVVIPADTRPVHQAGSLDTPSATGDHSSTRL
jgi:hypothetical protein